MGNCVFFITFNHLSYGILSITKPHTYMQSFPQQLLRKPEGNEAFLAYQAGLQGVFGTNNFPSSSMQVPQQCRKFVDLSQHGSNQGQGIEQQMLNPAQAAYFQYALQASQQKSALAMQSQQQQPKMGMLGPSSVKDQEMRMGNLKMQDLMSMQAMNQAQASLSRNSSEHFTRGDKRIEQGQQLAPEQKSEGKPSSQGPAVGNLIPGNIIRPVQGMATQQSIPNAMNNQIAMSAQLRAMQAWAHERNIDLSHPANANLMAQLMPLMQSRMVQQQKANDANLGAQSSPAPVSNQQVTSPAMASEGSDVSAQSGSAKARQTAPPSHMSPPISAGIASSSNDMAVQQFNLHGRDAQGSLKQSVMAGNGMSSVHPQLPSASMNLGADHPLNARTSSSGAEPSKLQYIRQLKSASQAGGPSSEGGSGNQTRTQGGSSQTPQQRNGFTRQQLHVLKAQILAFRRLKV